MLYFSQNFTQISWKISIQTFSPSELDDLKKGLEIYLSAEEIQERLQRRAELLAAEADEDECSGCEGCSNEGGTVGVDWEEEEQEAPAPPVKKPSKKKAAKA